MTIMTITSSLCVSVLLMAHLASPYPISPGELSQPRADVLLLQDLLNRLEFFSEQRAVDVSQTGRELEQQMGVPPERAATDQLHDELRDESRDELDEALIRELLSGKNLKQLRNNSNKNSSGCFGRRMDRIGSMSSLGCNTVGRNSDQTLEHCGGS
uniref:B-type natriuretic peptide n=1 Tax=Neogobius melanostomus TaxID=47308 RepID=A0A8C6UVN6_9GOBI